MPLCLTGGWDAGIYSHRAIPMNTPTEIDPTKYLNLVRHIAKDFMRRRGCRDPIDDTDEFSQGCIGLMEAAHHFNPDHGCQFSTYANAYVWGYIMRGTWRRVGYKPMVQLSQINNPNGDEKQVLDSTAWQVESRDWMAWALGSIHGRTRAMVADRFIKGRTFQEIADDWDITTQRVQQIVKNGVRTIRIRLRNAGLMRSDFQKTAGLMGEPRKLA